MLNKKAEIKKTQVHDQEEVEAVKDYDMSSVNKEALTSRLIILLF